MRVHLHLVTSLSVKQTDKPWKLQRGWFHSLCIFHASSLITFFRKKSRQFCTRESIALYLIFHPLRQKDIQHSMDSFVWNWSCGCAKKSTKSWIFCKMLRDSCFRVTFLVMTVLSAAITANVKYITKELIFSKKYLLFKIRQFSWVLLLMTEVSIR
jgi:hypothetical protein